MPRKRKQPEPQSLQRKKADDSFDAPPIPDERFRDVRRVVLRMNAFLREYDRQFGNISVACRLTGIDRRTYYRWMSGTAPIYKRFQRKVLKILPGEKLLDAAEFTITTKISDGDLTAAMFVMNKLGHKRGWQEKPREYQQQPVNADAAIAAVRSYQMWLDDHPDATADEKATWLARFAKSSGIDESTLVRTMKVQEITASVQ